VSWTDVPGYVSERSEYGETTVVVAVGRLAEAARYLRDVEGWSMLVDIAATDYLGWGQEAVAGYIGTAGGRDINQPGSAGLATLPGPRPRRFSMSYHLLKLAKPLRHFFKFCFEFVSARQFSGRTSSVIAK